jgi:hypothetical protein
MATIQALMNPINEAIKAKEYKKAFELIERCKKEMPSMKMNLNMMQFSVLVKSDEKKAIEFGKEWVKDFKSAPMYVMSGIYKEDGLKKSTYLWAAKKFRSLRTGNECSAEDALATTYAKGGDYKNAVKHQEKAIALAETALKTRKWSVQLWTIP